MNNYIVSDDKSQLSINVIHSFLSNSYWAKGRSIETITKSINNSDCFGIYDNGNQIGFARVVSDYTIFAYLFDVFILEEYRGRGLSKMLLSYVFDHPKYKDVKKWGLATSDAHGLYRKFGFEVVASPEKLMEKVIHPK